MPAISCGHPTFRAARSPVAHARTRRGRGAALALFRRSMIAGAVIERVSGTTSNPDGSGLWPGGLAALSTSLACRFEHEEDATGVVHVGDGKIRDRTWLGGQEATDRCGGGKNLGWSRAFEVARVPIGNHVPCRSSEDHRGELVASGIRGWQVDGNCARPIRPETLPAQVQVAHDVLRDAAHGAGRADHDRNGAWRRLPVRPERDGGQERCRGQYWEPASHGYQKKSDTAPRNPGSRLSVR